MPIDNESVDGGISKAGKNHRSSRGFRFVPEENGMERETIIDDDDASLFLYPAIGTVYHIIKRNIEGEKLRNLMAKAAEAFVANKCTKYLSDDRKIMSFKPEDLMWALENWEKVLIPAGWKHWALIMPGKVLGRVMAKKLAARYIDQHIDVRIFTDEASALEWLTGIRD